MSKYEYQLVYRQDEFSDIFRIRLDEAGRNGFHFVGITRNFVIMEREIEEIDEHAEEVQKRLDEITNR